jgi:hypothetical protein
MALFQRWFNDPVASSTLAIAIVAGFFAVYQLRSIPGERRRRILDAMVTQYAESAPNRGQFLRACPILLKIAYEELTGRLEEEIARAEQLVRGGNAEDAAAADLRLRRLYKLRKDAVLWGGQQIGISFTNAAEILASEFKTRALMWCIETLQDEDKRRACGVSDELYGIAIELVNQLNNFALDYENGAYPPRIFLGQLHRSIAPITKALEPIIWERSLNGRWGRRVLRLGLSAQHFNDVVKIHRSNDLIWVGSARRVVIHPAKTIDIFGKELLKNNVPTAPRLLPMVRLRVTSAYWWIIGTASPRPSIWIWSFGGLRLRRHKKCEDQLSAGIRFALRNFKTGDASVSLSFSWSLDTLRRDIAQVTKSQSTAIKGGKLAWLYVKRFDGGTS